jgi:hypothetical protein
VSSCDKFEPDRTVFKETEPGFFTYTGLAKCKHCDRAFHDPSGAVLKVGAKFAANVIRFLS